MGAARWFRTLIGIAAGLLLALPGCALQGKWETTGTSVLKKQLERSTDVARTEDRFVAKVDPKAALLRLQAARRSHCRAVEVQQVQDDQKWRSKRCKVGYGLAGMLMAAGAAFGTAGASLTASGVKENGLDDGDEERAKSRLGVGATLLALGVGGIVAGIVELVHQRKAKRQCRTPRKGKIRTEREPTTYPCGDKPVASTKLTIAVPVPTAKKKSEDDEDDEDDEESDSKTVYRTLSVQTDAAGAVTLPLARLLAATWATRLAGHLKITHGSKTTKVELSGADDLASLCKKLVATRTVKPVATGASRVLDFAAPAQAIVRRLTLGCAADENLSVALQGKVLAVDWKDAAPAAAAQLAKGQPATIACKKAKPSILQLVVPAGSAVKLTVSSPQATP